MEQSESSQGSCDHTDGVTQHADHQEHLNQQQGFHEEPNKDKHDKKEPTTIKEDKEANDDEEIDDDNEGEGEANEAGDLGIHAMVARNNRRRRGLDINKENEEDELRFSSIEIEPKITDPVILAQIELIKTATPTTDLEIALTTTLDRKQKHIDRLTQEIIKLKQFISKRKQTYKRKRKDDGAPTRALSAYNIFIQDRFARLAKENEEALTSEDKDATLKRVPPASLVSTTGNEWKTLSAEVKKQYEERAKADRKRYEEQMVQYQPPDKNSNRKRNKTGYNMFFSAHVLRLKQTESGVPSERGSVARLVGTAWKQLSADDKAYYEREADKHNGMNPVKEGEDEDEEEELKHQQMEYHMHMAAQNEMQIHGGMGPPIHGGMPLPHAQHDARHHHGYYPPHMYGPPPPYGHYDYSQHHQRHQQARAQGYQQAYPPPQRHPYE